MLSYFYLFNTIIFSFIIILHRIVVGLIRLKRFSDKRENWNFANHFENNIPVNEKKVAIVSIDGETGKSYSTTYGDMEKQANQVGHWLRKELNIKNTETVAVMMSNRAEFLSILLGCAKVHAVPACLNTNLTGASLSHCINVMIKFIFRIIDYEILNYINYLIRLQKQKLSLLNTDMQKKFLLSIMN